MVLGTSGIVCILSPIYLILFLNLLMMIKVLYHLKVILKNDRNARAKWLKLAKATLVLSILLGLNLIIPVIITRPLEHMPCAHAVVGLLNQISSTLQGLVFAVLFVLVKTEIREHLKRVTERRYNRLSRGSRSLSQGSQRTGSTSGGTSSLNGNPHSKRGSRLSQVSRGSTASYNGNPPSPRLSQASRFSQSSLMAARGSTASSNGNPPSPRRLRSSQVSRLSQSTPLAARGSTVSYNGTPPSPHRSRSSQASRLSQSSLMNTVSCNGNPPSPSRSLPSNGNTGPCNGNILHPPSPRGSRTSESTLTASFNPHSSQVTLTTSFQPLKPYESDESCSSEALIPSPLLTSTPNGSKESHHGNGLHQSKQDKHLVEDINSNDIMVLLTSNV
ncbi:uncharacterized protein [Amphiura filiformis]|uniref:uncharacterized protein n=1 Tax=Amphiura filiformis TaxID=82378 RepID=UPI003B20FA7C